MRNAHENRAKKARRLRLHAAGGIAFLACALIGARAHAGPFDLDDDGSKPDAGAPPPTIETLSPPAPIATIKTHAYTLAECLALAEKNHPNLWAQRAKLGYVHAQLDEAKWAPFSQFQASSNFGVLPPITGTIVYTSTPLSALSLSLAQSLQPSFSFDINGVIPLWTFGKITSLREAAAANVRVTEWELEQSREQTRMDVRKAYFGLMFARDARYVIDDVVGRLNKMVADMTTRLRKGEKGIDEGDRLRLEVYREEVISRTGDPKKGETFAIAALRYMTGVQSSFDIPDVPLKRPEAALSPIVSYLSAARLFRPEVNRARAGIVAREAQVNFARASFFPDIGLGMFASYAIAPSVTTQNAALINNGFNHFYYGAALGMKWGFDFLPKSARLSEAQFQLEETRSLERRALGEVAVEVENTYGTVVEAKGREESWARAESKAKEWIATVEDQIETGAKTESALTDPLKAYITARVNHLQALFDLNVSTSDLARASGWDTSAPTGT